MAGFSGLNRRDYGLRVTGRTEVTGRALFEAPAANRAPKAKLMQRPARDGPVVDQRRRGQNHLNSSCTVTTFGIDSSSRFVSLPRLSKRSMTHHPRQSSASSNARLTNSATASRSGESNLFSFFRKAFISDLKAGSLMYLRLQTSRRHAISSCELSVQDFKPGSSFRTQSRTSPQNRVLSTSDQLRLRST